MFVLKYFDILYNAKIKINLKMFYLTQTIHKLPCILSRNKKEFSLGLGEILRMLKKIL